MPGPYQGAGRRVLTARTQFLHICDSRRSLQDFGRPGDAIVCFGKSRLQRRAGLFASLSKIAPGATRIDAPPMTGLVVQLIHSITSGCWSSTFRTARRNSCDVFVAVDLPAGRVALAGSR